MSEQNKALVRRTFEEGVSKGNWAVMEETHDAGYISHRPTEDLDFEAWKKSGEEMSAALGVPQVTIEDMIAEGDKVVTRWTWNVTHQGTFMGIAPTGKRVTLTGITISRVAGGKIVEGWLQADNLGLMQQLGAIPS